MMDKKNANGISSKAPESGQRKQLPYSVETPYGFHLDLDFLKYVDDIEKGNTIKRVHIQRRNRGPKFSTLPRNFSLPGHASRAAPKDSWASTCTLGPKPKSRVMEVQQIFEIRACDSGSSGYPRAPVVSCKSPKAGEDASVRAFDEQPLGLHIRPHLLRASSMPVTVLQRKSSESVEDQGAQAGGESCKENGSSENVFCSTDVLDRTCSAPQDLVRLQQQFATALHRIRELEEQVRTIPELQAEICTLREEKEQLLLKLTSQPPVVIQDSVQHADESMIVDAAPSTDQQSVPSSVQETDHQGITQKQEMGEQEETDKPLDQSVAQEEGAESSIAQEPTVHKPTESSSALESTEQEQAETPSAPETLKQEEAEESPSVQEIVKQEEAEESPSVQETVKQEEAEESPSVQETVKQEEAEESPSVQETVKQEEAEKSPSVQEIVKQEEAEVSSLVVESEKQEEAEESLSAKESEKQEEAEVSYSVQEIVKQEEVEEGPSVVDSEKEETEERPSVQEIVKQVEVEEEPPSEEKVKQEEVEEGPPLEEKVKQEEVEEGPPSETVKQEETEESPPVQETMKQEEVKESPSVQETVKLEEAEERPLAVESEKQEEAAEGPSVQESAEQEATESSMAQESVEQEAAAGIPLAQELIKQEPAAENFSALESVKQNETQELVKTAEGPSSQELARQEAGKNLPIQELVKQDEAIQQRCIVESDSVLEVHVIERDLSLTSQQTSSVSENLTIKALQEKLIVLEQKFSDANKELEKTNALLSEQIEENKLKDERIKQLTEEVESYGKADKAQVDKEAGDLVDTKQYANPTPDPDAEPKSLSHQGVSTDEELPSAVSVHIISNPQKDLTSSSTQTDLTEDQQSANVFVEKSTEGEIATSDQAMESAPQEAPCSDIQEDITAGTAGESEGLVEPENPKCPTSEGVEEISCSEDLRQSRQKDQDQEPHHSGTSEPTVAHAAIGQYVTKIQGLLNEQWTYLGSGHPEVTSTLKQPASKFSSIQTQLVSSLNALSSFYSSPGQKGGVTRQTGLKSIMKKNDCADKPGNGGAKKNLKFVGVNGGYETTSSEESSGEDNAEEDSSEPEEKEEAASADVEEQVAEGAQAAVPDGDGNGEGDRDGSGDGGGDTTAQDISSGSQEEEPARETVAEDFMAACHFIKDRLSEVAAPDKEMREALTVLYQEWFRISSQKDSLVDTVTLYLKEVGAATPTLLRFIVNLADGNGNTALHYSVSHSNFPIVKLLLDTGLCEVDHQNKAGYTAIMLASLTAADAPEDMEVALQLLQAGNVNARATQAGQTALMLAVSHGRTAMVRLLLTCEADLNMQDHDGSTALMCACEHGHTEIVRLLLERPDCDLSLTDREGHSALMVAMQASHAEIVDLLKAHTSDGASDAPKPL